MTCPNCGETLVMSERSGVEIDYCPNCRGVWLDRGELDKIIERSAGYDAPRQTPQRDPHRGHEGDYRKKKRDSFLGDLFDF